MHINLASLNRYHEGLILILSLIKFIFQIIGITEHKIKDCIPLTNIEIPSFHEFIYTHTQTNSGGTGFYINDTLVYKKRDDLSLKPPGPYDFESTFVEIIVPTRKKIIVGCIYRHPSSIIPINEFTEEYLDPALRKISSENKFCSLVGDFDIDLILIKTYTRPEINI